MKIENITPAAKKKIVQTITFDPWPFAKREVNTILPFLNEQGILRPAEEGLHDGNWQLWDGRDNMIVVFDDGTLAVSSTRGVEAHQAAL